MSLLSSSIGRVRCLADEEADHNMLQDLQLAAELGKTLLERNKELENCIKLHQCTIDDQAQEIDHMRKQTVALKEVNDSRLKIYEQLEVSVQDLERANHRLALENANDKKQMKSQCLTIDSLEARIDELQKKYDELNANYEALLRTQVQKTKSPKESSVTESVTYNTTTNRRKTSPLRDGSTKSPAVSPRLTSPREESEIYQLATTIASDDDVTKLLQQLQEARSQRAREQKKVTELKEQLDALLHEHSQMEEQLNIWKIKAQDIKNLEDEINTLEEVRQGHLCGRCLRGMDSRTNDELSVMLDHEEDDELSLAESLADSMRDADTTLQEFSDKSNLTEEDNCNQYRVLVEKYEALLKIQQSSAIRRTSMKQASPNSGAMSLQEELQMSGEFCTFNSAQSEIESNHENGGRNSVSLRRDDNVRGKKPFASTPTDFSEAETSSSGFSDETSNKSTQTDGRPGSFLCSIADGDDCKFSIYDDNSTFESRFHSTPEYRLIFSEIFKVLKRAAEAKDEGVELPLLNNDSNDDATTPKVEQCPLVSMLNDDGASETTDDNRSIVSLAVSSVVSEPVFRVHTPVFSRKDDSRHFKRNSNEQQNNGMTTPDKKNSDTVVRPIHNTRRQPLEYLSVQVRKKSSAKKSSKKLNTSSEMPSTPDVIPTPNPRVIQLKGSGRRKFRPLTPSEISDGVIWNGHTAHFYPSKTVRSRQPQNSSFARENFTGNHQSKSNYSGEYKPGTASEEVAKLRRLEMSYAEALRMPNKSKGSNNRQRKNH